ncbi:MAG: hypothetical protein HY542_01725, partial [Deltaproteobacteria bacterium]|nr:hypothetical protein [Deltaproteobacteria bacterium]
MTKLFGLLGLIFLPQVALAVVDGEIREVATPATEVSLGSAVKYSTVFRNAGDEAISLRIRFTFSQPVTLVRAPTIGTTAQTCAVLAAGNQNQIECPRATDPQITLAAGRGLRLYNLEVRPSTPGDLTCTVELISAADANPANNSRAVPAVRVVTPWATTTLAQGTSGTEIDDVRIGANSSLALDANGDPVISYQQLFETGRATGIFSGGRPSYIRFSNRSWSIDRISTVEIDDVGERIGLGLDGTVAHFLLSGNMDSSPSLGYLSRDLSSSGSVWREEGLSGGEGSRWFDFGVGLGGPQAVYRKG